MDYQKYEPGERYAVKLHRGTEDVPDGWPDEVHMLAPALAEIPANPENGFPGSAARAAETVKDYLERLGYENAAREGFEEMTGAQINARCKKLADDHEAQIATAQRMRASAAELLNVTPKMERALSDGFEWPPESGHVYTIADIRSAVESFVHGAKAPFTVETVDFLEVELVRREDLLDLVEAALNAVSGAIAAKRAAARSRH